MDLRIFTEPQFRRHLRRSARGRSGGGGGRLRRLLPLRPLPADFGGDGLPGPTDSWVTLGAIARETARIRLGTLVTSATFRYPGPLAVAVAQVDEMSGGRVELGIGAGWYDGEHAPTASRSRHGRALRPARGAAGHHHRPVGDAGRRDLLVRRTALLPVTTPPPCRRTPVQSPRPPVIIGGHGSRDDRRPAPPMPTSSSFGFFPSPTSPPRWSGWPPPRGPGPGPGHDDLVRRPDRGDGRRRGRLSSDQAQAIGQDPRRVALGQLGGTARPDPGPPSAIWTSRRPGASTSRSSTSATSTTSPSPQRGVVAETCVHSESELAPRAPRLARLRRRSVHPALGRPRGSSPGGTRANGCRCRG